MTPDIPHQFNPPEHGLLPGEHLVWSRPAGVSFITKWCGGCLPLLAVIPGLVMFALFGTLIGSTFLLLLLTGFILTIRRFWTERRTMYYITSERVILVIGGQIIQAILLDHIEGKPSSEILEIKVTSYENASPMHSVRIIDPRVSLVITLKDIDEDTVEVFRRIGETVECPSCGHTNIAVRKQCTKCEKKLK
ncbi:MAG: hypothetical protein RTU30_05970 [Candidatus Thorarchaeota archaeon]